MQATQTRPSSTMPVQSSGVAPVEKGLTSHDAVATAIGLFAGIVVYAKVQGWDWPFLGSYRSGVVVLTVLGFAMCATGATITSMKGPFVATAAAVGVVALGIAVAGVIAGSKELFVALAATIAVLWAIATTRHALGRM